MQYFSTALGKLYIHFWGNKNVGELAAEIANIYNDNKTICIDAVGIGAGLKDILIDRGIYITFVIGSGSSSSQRYFNKRSELYGKLRDFLMAGGVIHCTSEVANKLRKELSIITAFFNDLGKIRIEEKRKMPQSPDIVDALTYCFADVKNESIYNNSSDNCFAGW